MNLEPMRLHLQNDGSVIVEFDSAPGPEQCMARVLVSEAAELPLTAILAVASIRAQAILVGAVIAAPSDHASAHQ